MPGAPAVLPPDREGGSIDFRARAAGPGWGRCVVVSIRVLRLTRHEASPEQVEALRCAFGKDLEIVQVSETVAGAAAIKALVQAHGADVLEAVLPLPLLAEVCDPERGVGVPVIRAVMDREVLPDGSVAFRFRVYERVKRVVVDTEPL